MPSRIVQEDLHKQHNIFNIQMTSIHKQWRIAVQNNERHTLIAENTENNAQRILFSPFVRDWVGLGGVGDVAYTLLVR